ncbi:MAG: YceI family protein [Pseudomonadales bacterium]|nr:YceI family protein [Pseudomonadales bacterium]
MFRYTVLLLILLSAQLAQASWHLNDAASTINFNSIKKGTIVESHVFKSISGTASEKHIEVNIDLKSVETQIAIRNSRMAELLFQVNSFPVATISTAMPIGVLTMQAGDVKSLIIDIKVDLHGVKVSLKAPVIIIKASEKLLQVSSQKAIVIHAEQFNLGGGIEALRKIAGLDSITPAIPVTFSLLFENNQAL